MVMDDLNAIKSHISMLNTFAPYEPGVRETFLNATRAIETLVLSLSKIETEVDEVPTPEDFKKWTNSTDGDAEVNFAIQTIAQTQFSRAEAIGFYGGWKCAWDKRVQILRDAGVVV